MVEDTQNQYKSTKECSHPLLERVERTISSLYPKDLIVSVNTLDGKATFNDVVAFEGIFITDTFVKTESERQRFILGNLNADTSAMTVEVTRGTVTDAYLEATDITTVNNISKVFFLEESESKNKK